MKFLLDLNQVVASTEKLKRLKYDLEPKGQFTENAFKDLLTGLEFITILGSDLKRVIKAKQRISKEVKNAGKNLYMSNFKLNEIIKELKEWRTAPDHKTMDINGKLYEFKEDCPLNLRRLYLSTRIDNKPYRSYEVIPTETFKQYIKDGHIDSRDSLSLELIQQSDRSNKFLLVLSNSLILADCWLNYYTKKAVLKVLGL